MRYRPRYAAISVSTYLLLSLCSCSMLGRVKEVEPGPTYLFHTVSFAGETVGLMSRWYTGDLHNWQAIMQHNPGLKAERLKLGDTVRIPRTLVVNPVPLPQSAVPVVKKLPPSVQRTATSTPKPDTVLPSANRAEAHSAETTLINYWSSLISNEKW